MKIIIETEDTGGNLDYALTELENTLNYLGVKYKLTSNNTYYQEKYGN